MKKHILVLCIIFITLNLWCVWEGNGVAGVATDFQEDGMFVRSSLFPKYTLIEIINLENDTKVRAIVLEGKETPGILLTFSPSVAEELKVQYGSVVRVRLSSPSLVEEDVSKKDIAKEDSLIKQDNVDIDESSIGELKEPVVEGKEDLVTTKDDNVEEKKDDVIPSRKKDEIVFYDFSPIAQNVEKKDRSEGSVSFDPAFIEEEVKLDIKIPNKMFEEEKKEVTKVGAKQKEVKIEENKLEVPFIIKEKEVSPIKKEEEKLPIIKEPKILSVPVAKKVYLENVPPRPPREVLSPKLEKKEVVEEKVRAVPNIPEVVKKKEFNEEQNSLPLKNEVSVKTNTASSLNIEKQIVSQAEVEAVKDVTEAPPMREKREVSTSKEYISSVKEIKMPTKNEEEQVESIIKDVKEVKVPIKNKDPQEESIIKDVEEVGMPIQRVLIKEVDERKDVKNVGGIIENHAINSDKDKYIRPVEEVESPKERKELKQGDMNREVPIVEAIKQEVLKEEESPIEEVNSVEEKSPVEEVESVEEKSPVEEVESVEEESPVEEVESVEEEPIEKEEPIEEEPIEEEVAVGEESQAKELNERPLREIEVRKHNNIEESPSKEKNRIGGDKNIVAIEEDRVGNKEERQNDVDENALKEIAVFNPQDETVEEDSSKEDIENMQNEERTKTEVKEESKEEKSSKEEIKMEEPKLIEDKSSEEPKPIEEAPIEELKSIEKKSIEEKAVEELPINKFPVKEELDFEEVKDLQQLKKEDPKKEDAIKREMPSQAIEEFPIGKTIKGYSYVQIAVYGSSLSVKEVLRKYSTQYPIVIEKRHNKYGHNYVVFIGPLQKDEVGAIQERFRSFGFIDAF